MPRPGLPPTPASSTDIMAQEKPRRPSLEMSFSLPPPAMSGTGSESSSVSTASGSSYHPASPISPETTALEHASRGHRRSSSGKKTKEDFTLPPPPTRSRKIIQMKPKTQSQDHMPMDSSPEKGKNAGKAKLSGPPSTTTGKRKQPSSSSAAGRKIARKTAHSLIERRRRSKMNEEFGTLKDMIPACRDQEMHKLAILQASIEYLRYLEQCIQDLKDNNKKPKSSSNRPPSTIQPPQSPHHQAIVASPTFSPKDTNRHYSFATASSTSMTPTRVSPALSPSLYHTSTSNGARQSHPSSYVASSSTGSASVTPSPALLPQQHSNHHIPSYTPSPALGPQRNNSFNNSGSAIMSPVAGPTNTAVDMDVDMEDHEATAALLMLNTMDRRSSTLSSSRPGTAVAAATTASEAKSNGENHSNGNIDTEREPVKGTEQRERGKGMSVRDLLSS